MDQLVTSELRFGKRNEFTFFPATRTVVCGETTTTLTQQESDFLSCVASGRGRVVSKMEIGEALHGGENKRKLYDVLVCRMRKKLGEGHTMLRRHKGGYSLAIPDKEYLNCIEFGEFIYYPEAARIVCDGKEKFLPPERNAVLNLLASRKGEFVPKAELYLVVLTVGRGGALAKVLDVVICHVRKCLDSLSPCGGDHIHTKWGVGVGLFDEVKPRQVAGAVRPRGPRERLLKNLASMRAEALSQLRL